MTRFGTDNGGLFDGFGWGRRIYTRRDWLPVASAVARDANGKVWGHTSRRGSLAVQIGPHATKHVDGSGAPAHYNERTGEVVVDSETALPRVDPATVRWDNQRWRKRHLRAVGLVEHEVGHAVHTPRGLGLRWVREAGERLASFGIAMEETRMEAQTVATGGDTAALSAVANELVLRDWHPSGDRFADAMNAALILGRDRKHGGAMKTADVDPYREQLAALLGQETVDALDGFLHEWNRTTDSEVAAMSGADLRAMYDRFTELVGATPDNEQGEGEGEQGEGGEGEGEGQGQGQGAGSPESGPESAEKARQAIRKRLIETAEDRAGAAAAAEAARDEREADSDREASKEITHGYGGGNTEGRTYDLPIDSAARKLAADLSSELRRVAMPDIRKRPTPRQLPPGKLRGRGALARSAQSAAGLVPDAEPFRHTRKIRTLTPPPVVGIMQDTSGSMKPAEATVATLAWALAEAGRSVQARVDYVSFGNVGRRVKHDPTRIKATSCDGGWENFREGFAILNRRLHLTDPYQGARVLFVLSDGGLVGPGEAEAAGKVCRHLERQGVVVVWVNVGHWVGDAYGVEGRVVAVDPSNPSAAARLLAGSLIAAMRGVRA